MVADEGTQYMNQKSYVIGHTVDIEEKLGQETLGMLNLDKIFNTKWPLFNLTFRSLQYKG